MSVNHRRFWFCLTVFAIAGLVVRVGVAVESPSIHRPDEIFQNLEPAHRLLSGWGITTWEWREGIRSWLLPGFLAEAMAVSGNASGNPAAALAVVAAVLSFISLGVIATGVVIGWRHSGLIGAALCGMLCSFWPDLIYFAPKPLAEVQAGNLLVVAAGLGMQLGVRPLRPRAIGLGVAIGALLGLAFCLRFQLAPAELVVAVWAGRKDARYGWLPLILGAAVPLAALGVSDWLAWGTPFQSIWKNVVVNLLEHRSDVYGVMPIYWYGLRLVQLWGAAVLAIAFFFVIGAQQARLMATVAVTVFIFHSLIAHKEISFIYAAVPPAMIVVGIGTARALLTLPALARPVVSVRHAAVGAALIWGLIALTTAESGLHSIWSEGTEFLPVWTEARRRTDLCGLALYGRVPFWQHTGGYTYLGRSVPIYLLYTPQEFEEAQHGFNYVVTRGQTELSLTGYSRVMCSHAYCLLRSEQPCVNVPQGEINAVLTRTGF